MSECSAPGEIAPSAPFSLHVKFDGIVRGSRFPSFSFPRTSIEARNNYWQWKTYVCAPALRQQLLLLLLNRKRLDRIRERGMELASKRKELQKEEEKKHRSRGRKALRKRLQLDLASKVK